MRCVNCDKWVKKGIDNQFCSEPCKDETLSFVDFAKRAMAEEESAD